MDQWNSEKAARATALVLAKGSAAVALGMLGLAILADVIVLPHLHLLEPYFTVYQVMLVTALTLVLMLLVSIRRELRAEDRWRARN